ncbi:MAG: precorrin-3B C(17)-methyltransferase [Zetaproteobacteria bacterium]|nr:MAG: precorrin-3B C(17)-methyltransferase [Zetaproteobacteria bacterium]
MTARARQAIAEAEVVIGYSTYIKLVRDLLEGKQVIRKGMTEEVGRCLDAWEHARAGRVVALISSGDAGIYGMAGPMFEVLWQQGWRPESGIEVEVVPGITALNGCASLVGAPLTHDACMISLSDLLTPWPVIRKRLEAAARADFVIGLYNPKSGRRTGQIVEAQRILLRHRRPDTPVAIVKSAYRRRQRVQLTRLDAMADQEIGMLSTVLIGNSTTFVRDGVMVTPRGYANKYAALTGETVAGEQAGRSLSMGLEGWHGCVRRWLASKGSPGSWEQVAAHFDAPLGEIFEAVAGADRASPAGIFAARAIDPEAALAALPAWGRLRFVVRAHGAVGELLAEGADFERKGEWLNLVTDAFHLHVRWSEVAAAWLARRGGASLGVHFLDAGGRLVFRALLVRADGAFDPAALDAFARCWEASCAPIVAERAV